MLAVCAGVRAWLLTMLAGLGLIAGSMYARVWCAECGRVRMQRPVSRARAAGIFLTGDPSKESIFLTRRKGFVRMAIQAGAGARDQKSSRLLARRVVSFLRCG